MIIAKFVANGFVMFLPAGAVVAAENAVSDNALPSWLQYGVLGLVIVALVITKQLVPGWIHQELRQENKELKADVKDLVKQNLAAQQVTLPALITATEVIKEAQEERKRLRGQP